MARLFVTYAAADGARFDRDYYVGTHLPLVEKAWGASGLRSAVGYFPVGPAAADVAVAVLTFDDDEAIAASLASPAAPAVMGDLPNFTDIAPVISKASPL